MRKEKWKRTRMFLVVLCVTGVASLAQALEYEGIWQDAGDTPSHNFYIQHFDGPDQPTVIIYTRDANTYYAFHSTMSDNVFEATSLDSEMALDLQLTFTSQTEGMATVSKIPPCITCVENINAERTYEAGVTDRSGIWKNTENTLNMYVQDFTTGSTIIVYTFDAEAFKGFQSMISGSTFSAVNLAYELSDHPPEQMTVEFLNSDTGTVSVGAVADDALGPQFAVFSYDISKVFTPCAPLCPPSDMQ